MNLLFAWWEELRRDKEALALITDWLGAGGVPVDRKEAEHRAKNCVRCPLNQHAGWWDMIKDMVAATIRKQLEIKNKIGLKTSHDDELHLCEACGCCNQLKVWVPMEHIATHTDLKAYDKFALDCWVRQGLNIAWKKRTA